jgi:hypothetical protein
MSAAGPGLETALIGAVLIFGGYGFARLGWAGVRRRVPEAVPGRELAPPPPMSSPAWRILWAASLVFGALVIVCGLLLVIGAFLPESGR